MERKDGEEGREGGDVGASALCVHRRSEDASATCNAPLKGPKENVRQPVQKQGIKSSTHKKFA